MDTAHRYLQQYLPWDALSSWPHGDGPGRIDRGAVAAALDAQVDPVRIPRPWLMGEFGLHHGGADAPMRWGADPGPQQYAAYAELVDLMRERGMGWTVWTYKDAAMGWMRPPAEGPWLRFACRPDFRAAREELRRLCGVHDWSEHGARPELYHRLAAIAPGLHWGEILARVRESKRLAEGLLLRWQLGELRRELGPDGLLAMADDWRLAVCRVVTAGEHLVREGCAGV